MSTSEKKKFVWDEKMSAMYIKICAAEVVAGNRPTTHLNKKGWSNVQEKFNLLSKRNLDMKQVKNKWDNLKKDWQLWKRLLGHETGLGWSLEKRTVEASDPWWEAKIKEIPAVAKFRDRGLFMPDEMELLFGDVVATGHQAWAPSAGVLPQVESQNPSIEGSGDSDDPPQVHVDAQVQDVQESLDKFKRRRMYSSGSTSKSKKKERSSTSVQESLERLSFVVEAVNKKTDSGIDEMLVVLDALQIKDDPDFYYDCLYWLGKEKDLRLIFVRLQDAQSQIGFLKKMITEKKK